MRRSDFTYELPPELIAQRPAERRDAARLLVLDGVTGDCRDRRFTDLPGLLRPGDLLVLNDTRVIPARLYGRKDTGGRVEILVERVEDDFLLLAQVRAGKAPGPGTRIRLEDDPGNDVGFEVAARRGDFHELRLHGRAGSVWEVLERYGHMPLPPYIRRGDEEADRDRYQTVYARTPGAVAAPTAGLHFTGELLDAVRARGAAVGHVTLHVGAGTFQPVRAEIVEKHRMHAERFRLDAALCDQVRATRRQGGRVIAVGTTVVRCLESAAAETGDPQPVEGETDIFIYPGYRFRAVDCLLTNFHLPESTLLMLVCAFAGTGNVLAAYRHAVEQRYRFYSYGDAMFITKD